MTFAWPFVLSLLLLPLAAVWLRRRPGAQQQESAHGKILRGQVEKEGVRLAEVSSAGPTQSAALPRLWLGLAFVILALARPQWGVISTPTYTQSREILVAIDLSRSMMAADIAPSRLERAKLLTRGLLDALRGERVGLVVFSGTSFLQCPLSADYEIMREFLPALSPDFLPQGGSNYQALLETALESFSSEGAADRFLIVLSDGEATDDFWREQMPELQKRRIRVIGLGVGTAAGSMIPQKEGGFVKDKLGAVVLSKLESGTLRALADGTQGLYRDASTWVDLVDLVKATVEKGNANRVVDTVRERREERFTWFLAPGLLLILWSLWREFPRSPQARDLPLLRASGKVVVGLFTLLLLATPRVEAADPVLPPPPSAPAAPSAPSANSDAGVIVALSRELARQDKVPAKEWSRFAQTTLDYARRRTTAREEVSTQALRDGLAAVNEGESLDEKAAPWADLRRQLNDYLHPSPTPTPPEPSPSPTPSGQPSGTPPPQDQKQGGTPPPSSGQPSPPPQPPSPSDKNQDGRNQDQKNENGGKPPERPKNDPSKAQSAFGDNKPTPPPPPASPRQEKQKVGGQSAQRTGPQPSVPPQLAAAQQRLDQVREDDKPAELQQLLRADSEPASKPEKDW